MSCNGVQSRLQASLMNVIMIIQIANILKAHVGHAMML